MNFLENLGPLVVIDVFGLGESGLVGLSEYALAKLAGQSEEGGRLRPQFFGVELRHDLMMMFRSLLLV